MSELRHYGVLGMKWGIRRYQNPDGTLTELGKKHGPYQYKSWGTKHNERKAEKARQKGNEAKAAKYEQRAKRSAELDRREQKYAERVKVGGNIVSRLFTNIGTKPYVMNLAILNGTSRQGITGRKVAAMIMTSLGGRIGSTLNKASYIRTDPNKPKWYQFSDLPEDVKK